VLHQLGIPRDIYKVELRFRAKDIIAYIIYIITYTLLYPCRCYGARFHSNSSWSEWKMLMGKF